MSRRPEQLLLAMLGEFLLGRDQMVPASVFLSVLSGFDIPELTTRSALTRMKKRGLLRDERRGRTLAFGLTDQARQIVGEADLRVRAEQPFAPAGDGWTLVSFTIPESRRELRHRLRTILTWAGFGLLRDGVWIAPGAVDVRSAIGDVLEGATDAGMTAFRASSLDDLTARRAIADAWDLPVICQAHVDFLAEWSNAIDGPSAVHDVVALLADWLVLLRADPRLPDDQLPSDWPASDSAATFARRYLALHARAQEEFVVAL